MTTPAIEKASAGAAPQKPAVRPVWGLAVAALAGGAALVAASCKEPSNAAPDAGASAALSAAPPGSAEAARVERDDPGGDGVRPVYPIDHKPPLPEAERYCNAVRELPKKRRQDCCPKAGLWAPTGECIRTLSSALGSGAVTIDAAALDGCVAAVTKETEGCDWVTSVGTPTTHACLGIIKGTLKEGAVCRSNLECEEGMRCRGLGATRPGRCASPLPKLGPCNIATDSLATFAGQDDLERHHPECEGYCARRACQDPHPVGAACTATFECGPKGYCAGGKCAEGPPPGPGQACTDQCGPGARCLKGKCAAYKAGGERCEEDAECRGHCAREDGGKAGTCAGDCPSFLVPVPRQGKR